MAAFTTQAVATFIQENFKMLLNGSTFASKLIHIVQMDTMGNQSVA